MRVLIVAEHASMQFGGEASLPFYYFKLLRERGVEAWMLVHARTREELKQAFPQDFDRIRFVPDTWLHRTLWRLGKPLPRKIDEQSLGSLSHLWTQILQRRLAKRLVRELKLDVVHETAPISPKQTSMMFGLGAPVVIGPLCGGMDYPPAFQYMQTAAARVFERVARRLSHMAHRLVPGKIQAEALVVANPLTRDALPLGVRGRVYEVVESGVDLRIWQANTQERRAPDGTVRFVFSGRLVDWKGADLLIDGFKVAATRSANATLLVIGDGPMRADLEQRVKDANLTSRVEFAGWMSRPDSAKRIAQSDVMVLPSMRECGGTVILEAMALGIPVIATNWGGPSIYVDDTTGIRVDPSSRQGFVEGLADAMVRLADSPELRRKMSEASLVRVRTLYFDWDSKVDRLIEIYRETVDHRATRVQ